MADSRQGLIERFTHFPGIGPRQARRFVYYLLAAPATAVETLIRDLQELRRSVRQCRECFRYFPLANHPNAKTCEICRDPAVDPTLLMVVEKDIDLENIRKSDTYRGRYFVLGGLAPVINEPFAKLIRLPELVNLVRRLSDLREIIIALAVNPEADYTVEVVKKTLGPLTTPHGVKISLLGRGLSTGTEIEYSDADTLKNALKNRA